MKLTTEQNTTVATKLRDQQLAAAATYRADTNSQWDADATETAAHEAFASNMRDGFADGQDAINSFRRTFQAAYTKAVTLTRKA